MYTHQFKINICSEFQEAIHRKDLAAIKQFLKNYTNWDGEISTILAAAIDLREVVYAPAMLKPEIKDILIKRGTMPVSLRLLFTDDQERASGPLLMTGKTFLELIELLIIKGAYVNNLKQKDQNPLALAIKPYTDPTCKFSYEANKLTKNLVKCLLSNGSNPNALMPFITYGQSCSSFVAEPSNKLWFLLDEFLQYQIDIMVQYKSFGSKEMLFEMIKTTSVEPITKYLNMKQIASIHKGSIVLFKSTIKLIDNAIQDTENPSLDDQKTQEVISQIIVEIKNVEELNSQGLSQEGRLARVQDILDKINYQIETQKNDREKLLRQNIQKLQNLKNNLSQNKLPDIEKIFADLSVSKLCNKKIPSIDHLQNTLDDSCNEELLQTWDLMQKNLGILKQFNIMHNSLKTIYGEIKWMSETWHKEFIDLFLKTPCEFQKITSEVDNFKTPDVILDQNHEPNILEHKNSTDQIGADSDLYKTVV